MSDPPIVDVERLLRWGQAVVDEAFDVVLTPDQERAVAQAAADLARVVEQAEPCP